MSRWLLAASLWLCMAQASPALTVEQRLVAGLQAQGYAIIEEGYTFLGRLRIVAENDRVHREIVVNPGTGEILRDYAVSLSDMPQTQPAPKLATHDNKGQDTTASASRTTTRDGTASAAASSLAPGSSTLGSGRIQVDTLTTDDEIRLDDPVLTLTPGLP